LASAADERLMPYRRRGRKRENAPFVTIACRVFRVPREVWRLTRSRER